MSSRKIQSNLHRTPNLMFNMPKEVCDPINNQTNSQPIQHAQPNTHHDGLRENVVDRSFFGDSLPIITKIWKILCRVLDEIIEQSLDDGTVEYTDLICRNPREYLAVKAIRDINQAQDQQFTASVFNKLKKEKKKRGL